MRMRPERAAKAQREVVFGAGTGQDRRPGDARNAILLPGRRQTMPMDESRHVELVVDANPELLSHFCDKARCAIRLANAEHRGRLSVPSDAAPLDAEDYSPPCFSPSARGGRLGPRTIGRSY